jgi:hypothetical protein
MLLLLSLKKNKVPLMEAAAVEEENTANPVSNLEKRLKEKDLYISTLEEQIGLLLRVSENDDEEKAKYKQCLSILMKKNMDHISCNRIFMDGVNEVREGEKAWLAKKEEEFRLGPVFNKCLQAESEKRIEELIQKGCFIE